ncbi:TonB-dependent receptor plug domain-containing protein [Sphingomonas sp. 10B4]|uniref:TonB-dependent receptor plug domain-containing protein n=1 Tax=Sphingomonas sp. 10B4 TaxID=3048575 RepID=UPI002AB42A55|nr:TonB-dependent receptor [Sphingomonas sp. 10B4]MDY7523135.1 TonB-dependent receptor [Sphingomonas sp. 10B4]
MTSLPIVSLLLASASLTTLAPAFAHAAQSRDDDHDKPVRTAKKPSRHFSPPAKPKSNSAPRRDDDDDDDEKPVRLAPTQASAAPLTAAISSSPSTPIAVPAPPVVPPATAKRDDDGDDGPAPVGDIIVQAERLDKARAAVDPSLGASTYTLTNDAIEKRPGGETTTLAQILLQAPGVTQSGNGSLRVRAQGDLQYRINNVIVPDGLSDLGESLSARFVDRVQLVAGALPAQYGLHAGGVVNITTKSGVFDRGGQAEIYGGSQSEIEPAFEYGGAFGKTNLFVSGSYRHNDVGLSAPDRSAIPAHDRTDQFDGFGYLDRIIDDQTRVSLILGTSNERFQLPALATDPAPHGTETQNADYALANILRTAGDLTLQASAFARYSRLNTVGDRIAPSLIQAADTSGLTGGLQIEAAYVASPRHTLRSGAVISFDGGRTVSSTQVEAEHSTEHRTIATGFVQDEWRPLDGVVVNGGLRFDHVSGTGGGDRLSPRLDLIWSPGGGIDMHGGYARYFVPASQEALTLAESGGGNAGGPLHPETDDYYDIGLQRTRGGLTLGIDGYIRRSRDMLVDAPFGQGSQQLFYNFASGRSKGIEFTMTYANGPFAAWSNLSIARTEGRDIISSRALFAAPYLANIATRYVPIDQDQTATASGGVSYRLDRLRLSSDMLYGSGVRATRASGTVNDATLPNYVQINIAGLYRLSGLASKPLNLRLDLINAFNARYQLRDGTALGGGTPQLARGRGIFAGIEQLF